MSHLCLWSFSYPLHCIALPIVARKHHAMVKTERVSDGIDALSSQCLFLQLQTFSKTCSKTLHCGPTSSVADSPIGRGCIGTSRSLLGEMIRMTAVSVKGSDPTSSPLSTSRLGKSSPVESPEPELPAVVSKNTICRSCGPMSLTTW